MDKWRFRGVFSGVFRDALELSKAFQVISDGSVVAFQGGGGYSEYYRVKQWGSKYFISPARDLRVFQEI